MRRGGRDHPLEGSQGPSFLPRSPKLRGSSRTSTPPSPWQLPFTPSITIFCLTLKQSLTPPASALADFCPFSPAATASWGISLPGKEGAAHRAQHSAVLGRWFERNFSFQRRRCRDACHPDAPEAFGW